MTDESLGSNAEDHTPSGASSMLPQSDENNVKSHRSPPVARNSKNDSKKWQERLKYYQKKIKENGEEIVAYLISNLWSLLPAAVALLLVVLAGQFMAVSHNGCDVPGQIDAQGQTLIPRVNPVICPDMAVMRGVFGAIRGPKDKPKYMLPIPVGYAGPVRRNEVEITRRKAITDAESELKEAERLYQFHVANSSRNDPTANLEKTKQDAELAKNLAQARSKLDEQKTKFDAVAEAMTHVVLLREARARTLWFVGYGLSLAVTLGTILAMAWIIGTEFGDQWAPSGLNDPKSERKAALIFLIIISLGVLLLIAWGGYSVIDYWFFDGYSVPGLFKSIGDLLGVNDSLRSSLFDETGRILSMIDALNGAVIVAVSFIAAAVTMALYQHPEQEKSRDEKTWKDAAAAQSCDAYDQFLARCFRRLSVAIYFGAILLLSCVIRIGAEYSWPSALLDPAATDEPAKTSLSSALTALTDLLTFTYGLIFTLVLIGLFLPAWIILRRRAWQLVRTRRAEETGRTLQSDEQWLELRGLSFTSFQHLTQILALLAPLGAGTFIAALKGLVGG